MPVWGPIALLVTIPWRWLPSFEIGPIERSTEKTAPAKREDKPFERTTMPTEPATQRTDTLPVAGRSAVSQSNRQSSVAFENRCLQLRALFALPQCSSE